MSSLLESLGSYLFPSPAVKHFQEMHDSSRDMSRFTIVAGVRTKDEDFVPEEQIGRAINRIRDAWLVLTEKERVDQKPKAFALLNNIRAACKDKPEIQIMVVNFEQWITTNGKKIVTTEHKEEKKGDRLDNEAYCFVDLE